MLPDDVLSTESLPSPFLGARALPVTKTVDYEQGGVALNDASLGIDYQRWRARLLDANRVTSRVMLGAPNQAEFQLYAAPGITEISIAFDRNMNPALAFVQGGVAKLWWYDSTASAMIVTEIGAGVITPRVTHDDKRPEANSWSDVILGYVRDGVLYYRQQRDRYQIERALAAGVNGLIKIGMGRGLRLQFQCEPA